MDAFWHYLAARGITSHRSVSFFVSGLPVESLTNISKIQGIVNAIAQKVDIMIPGIAQLEATE
jgi:hypothetical protein